MNQAPVLLITLFHMTLEVVRSELRVVNSPSYIPLSKFPPVIMHTLFFFLLAVVNYDSGVGYDSFVGDVFNAFEVKKSHCIRLLGVIRSTTFSTALNETSRFLAYCLFPIFSRDGVSNELFVLCDGLFCH